MPFENGVMTEEEIEILLELEPEELAIEMIFVIQKMMSPPLSQRFCSALGIINHFTRNLQNHSPKDRAMKGNVGRAIWEAWSWLEANTLVVWPDQQNGSNGYRILSRRAEKLSSEQLVSYRKATGLSRDHLHPSIANKVWSEFIRGQYDTAVFLASKQVEISVKAKSGIDEIGVKLMRLAFKPENGPLSDKSLPKGEQDARMGLFAGFLGSYKNPGSHRDVNLDDPIEAIQVVLFASHLLNIIDSA